MKVERIHTVNSYLTLFLENKELIYITKGEVASISLTSHLTKDSCSNVQMSVYLWLLIGLLAA